VLKTKPASYSFSVPNMLHINVDVHVNEIENNLKKFFVQDVTVRETRIKLGRSHLCIENFKKGETYYMNRSS
jgi:hypothetical protein